MIEVGQAGVSNSPSGTLCIACGARADRLVLRSVQASRFGLRHCDACGLEFMWPQPSWEEIERIYSADYYATWDMKEGESESTGRMKRLTFARRLRELRPLVSAGRVLDIGTATGFFLDEVKLVPGYEPYGIEVSEYAGGIARGKFGADRIHIGTLETAPFPPDFFAAVTMSDLIEHVQDPHRALQQTRRLLQPGGVAMIVTPDAASLSRKVLGGRWTHLSSSTSSCSRRNP